MTTYFSILAWRIPLTEEPNGLQSRGVAKCQTQLSDGAHARARAHTHTHTHIISQSQSVNPIFPVFWSQSSFLVCWCLLNVRHCVKNFIYVMERKNCCSLNLERWQKSIKGLKKNPVFLLGIHLNRLVGYKSRNISEQNQTGIS